MSGERRSVSGWFILSAVYLVLVFGLFFTFTERRTWPESGLRLGPSDMRLVPQITTLWCEAVEMQSPHAFVAYQVSEEISVNPLKMELQEVDLRTRLGVSWGSSSVKLKYFLLPSSVIQMFACASHPFAKILIFKGDLDVEKCLQSLDYEEFSRSSSYDSDESSEEDYDSTPSNADSRKIFCSSLIAQKSIDVNFVEGYISTDCGPMTRLSPLKVNVTSADEYVIVMWNFNRQHINYLNSHILIDRTRYAIRRHGQPLDICSLSTTCTIGLDFASDDRVLVSIPEEQNSGRFSFDVHYRCKPRLAVFAILSVFLPLLFFIAIAMVIRTDRETLFARICFRKRNRRNLNPPRFASPLLEENRSTESFDSIPVSEEQQSERVDEPPPYHTLYDSPPPYSCVGNGKKKTSPSR